MDKSQQKQKKKKPKTRREAFDNWLRKKGVMTALTRVLINLYDEEQRPDCAMEYIRDKLAFNANIPTYKEMASELQEVLGRVQQLHVQVVQLRYTLEELEAADEQEEQEEGEEEEEGEADTDETN